MNDMRVADGAGTNMSSPGELCQQYLKEIARTLGEDRGNASRAWYSRGWFYLKIASRYGDGSVGSIRDADPLRRSALLNRLENLRKRPDYKGTKMSQQEWRDL